MGIPCVGSCFLFFVSGPLATTITISGVAEELDDEAEARADPGGAEKPNERPGPDTTLPPLLVEEEEEAANNWGCGWLEIGFTSDANSESEKPGVAGDGAEKRVS